jgi:dTDP-4-amino-4,6-dideoxygalactose transaminase
MKVPFNDLKREYDSIQAEIDAAIHTVIHKSAFIKGEFLKTFEKEFATYNGVNYAVGSSSGTTALHLALKAFGVQPGDEVITVANTFIGTTEPITHCGGKIVFVDCDPETYTIDTRHIESVITPKTKALVPVHLFGQMAEMEVICTIARKYNLVVIEDAAQAIGAEYKGKKAGNYGDAACYSFYPGKNLGAYGDGGCIVTNNAEAAQTMRMLADHGRLDKYFHQMEGYNYRLDALQAAILSVKLRYIDRWNEARRKAARYYTEHLSLKPIPSGQDGIITPFEAQDRKHVYHIYCIRVPKRDTVQKHLQELGVPTGIHYPIPLHLQPAYRQLGIPKGTLPETERAAEEILSLPIFPFMTMEETAYVAEMVRTVIKEYR